MRDQARLTVRGQTADGNSDAQRQPVRAILDTRLELDDSARLFSEAGPIVVYTCEAHEGKVQRLERAGADVRVLPREQDRVAIAAVMADCVREAWHSVWVEAGATLSGAFMQAGWVDEWVVYVAPTVLGMDGLGLLALPSLTQLAQAQRFNYQSVRQLAQDLRLVLTPQARQSDSVV
jgi:diaminohydroxyphosphoribosylaminopyrimidine deaminase / 5-amino-6-(5-phosphoribosylamino)uracil reductase